MEIGLFVAYAALCTMALLPIYYGSFASVKWPKKSRARSRPLHQESESSSEEESSTESLSTEDAYLFPIFGSLVLFSLYVVFKLLDKDYVNYLVTAYFGFLGVISVTTVGVSIVKNLGLFKVDAYKFTLRKRSKEIYKASFTVIHLVTLLLSVVLTGYYVATKNWIASNIFGLSFAFSGIQMLSLDSFKTGMILLSGLFFYDIFWVFGTEVMVTVAKSFDAPIKVVWPKQYFGLAPDETLQFTMLGLGDIVIPGIYVALCLRFDHDLYLKRNPNATRYSKFPATYFKTCYAAYILGLITTIVVMHTFKAAQPALLYLSPACIFSVLLTGTIKGQLKEIFSYSSETDEEKKKKAEEKKKNDESKIKNATDDTEDDTSKDIKDSTRSGAEGEEDYVEVSSLSSVGAKNRKKKGSKKITG